MSMNLVQASDYLGVPAKKLERWLRQGVIPSHSENGAVCFYQNELEHWARKKRLPGKRKTATAVEDHSLRDAISNGGIHVIDANDRDEALRQAVSCMELPATVDPRDLFDKLIEREQIVSTGMGRGVAIPHPPRPVDMGERGAVVGCIFLREPVDFAALDGQEVFCMFLLLSPDPNAHLKLLSGLAQALKKPGFNEVLMSRPDPEQLITYLEDIL